MIQNVELDTLVFKFLYGWGCDGLAAISCAINWWPS